ncbi:uncharacterized protein LOC144448627 isoform X2 [Glandiceps talaboti]
MRLLLVLFVSSVTLTLVQGEGGFVKPGQCPLVGDEIGTCAVLCSEDEQCYGNKKCCHNGCGTECMELPMQDAQGVCSFMRVMLESAVAAKKSSAGDLKLYVPICDDDGNFDIVQCNDNIDVCWCANKRGTRLEGSLGEIVKGGEQYRCDDYDLSETCDAPVCNLGDMCKFGYKADQNGCPICQCFDPCEGIQCPGGTECHAMHVLCSSKDCSGIPQCVSPPPACDNGKTPVSCLIDPCNTATCPANPTASCRTDNCGSCKAEFIDNSDQIVDCTAEGTLTCPEQDPGIITICEDKCGKGCKEGKMCCSVGCSRDCLTPVLAGLTACQLAAKRATSPEVFSMSEGAMTPLERMVPRCTADGRYEKIQCADSIGICWCVNQGTGAEVRGTAVRGIPECESGERKDPVNICPNGEEVEICGQNLCYQAVCLAHPAAVCRVNPCGSCTVEFFDHNNNRVDCSVGLSECRSQRQVALNSNNRGFYLGSIMKNLPEQVKDFVNKLGGVCGIPYSSNGDFPKMAGLTGGIPNLDTIFQILFDEGNSNLPSLDDLTDIIESWGGNLGDAAGIDVEDLFDGLQTLQERLGDLVGSIFGFGPTRRRRSDDGNDSTTNLPPLFGPFVPRCSDDGAFAWKQCHGNTGVCWCVSSDGKAKVSTMSTRPASNALKCDEGGKVDNDDDDDGGQTVTCPDGTPLKLCLDVSCSRTLCPGNPDAFCVIDPCNNCAETWKTCYDLDGNVECDKEAAQLCSSDQPAQICTQDLCAQQTCKWNRCATCKMDICGECKAKFYDRQGNEVNCRKPASKCQLENHCAPVGLIGADVPECSDDGKYEPKQCHPSTGFCWCVDESGKKIEGTDTRDELECDAVPIQSVSISFTIHGDFSLIKDQVANFKMILTNHLVEEFDLADAKMIQNMEVKEGSIIVSYDLVSIEESETPVSDIAQYMESEFKSGHFKVKYEDHEFNIDEETTKFSMQQAEPASSGGSSGSGSGVVVAVVVVLLIVVVVGAVVGYVVYRKQCRMGGSTAKYMRSKDGPEVSFETDTYSLPSPNSA